MARSNTDNPNQENSQQQDREEREPGKNSSSSRRRESKLPDQFRQTRTVQIPDVDVVAVRVHLKSHVAVREGKRILVPHLLKDQEPLGAENVNILAVSKLISRN